MATTPRELAEKIGVDQKKIRIVLRARYRPSGENKSARWLLDDGMVQYVTKALVK